MRFYYRNYCGDEGYFSENDLVKAIYTAWNIEAELFLVKPGVRKINWSGDWSEECDLIFCPYESNDFNSAQLEDYGYKMIDGDEYREIVDVRTGEIIMYDWSEVKQLV